VEFTTLVPDRGRAQLSPVDADAAPERMLMVRLLAHSCTDPLTMDAFQRRTVGAVSSSSSSSLPPPRSNFLRRALSYIASEDTAPYRSASFKVIVFAATILALKRFGQELVPANVS
jgi:hypothetical protein